MGQPREGMPVACVKGGERPFDVRPIQPAFDVRIFRDVVRVVVIDKLIPSRRQENQQRHQGEEQGNSARTRHCLIKSARLVVASAIPERAKFAQSLFYPLEKRS